MIDSHCHPDTFFHSGELGSVLERAEAAGVRALIAAGTNPEDWNIYRRLAGDFPEKIFYAAGIHPTEIDEDFFGKLEELEKYFSETPSPVAVGEIGLDRHWLPKDAVESNRIFARQVEVFSRQLDLARRFDMPVIVHARDAFEETVEAIDRSGVAWNRIVFHCFAEGAEEVRLINRRGGTASFTGTITYKNAARVREALIAQGRERLMIETDCPYLAPGKRRGMRNEPAFLRETLDFAAELLGMSFDEADVLSEKITRAFFRLPPAPPRCEKC